MTTILSYPPVTWVAPLFARIVDSDVEAERQRILLKDRIDLLYSQGRVGVVVHTIVVCVLTYLFWQAVPTAQLAAWAVAMIILGWARGVAIYLFHKAKPDVHSAANWGALFVVLIGLVGIAWGYAGVFIVPNSYLEQVLFILLLGGTAAGTATTLAPLFAAIVIALSTSVLPLVVRFALDANFEQQLMGGALVMFYMAMMTTGRNASETITMALALRQDNADLVTSLECERGALEVSNRAKTRFLAAASHDLRQPLHAISLTVAAHRLKATPGDLEPLFDRIERSVNAMEGLVDSLLDISKLDAGTIRVRITLMDVGDVFSTVASETSAMAAATHCSIDAAPCDVVLPTDRTLLESVVRNLVGNAIRHAPGSHIVLSADMPNETTVLISVSDDGPGIPRDLQENVFEEFFQAGGASADQGGLGLGLAIVKRHVALLGGEIRLESEPGRGARFEVTLPATVDGSGIDTDEQHETVDATSLNGLCVAILEDNKDNQAALLDLVSIWGCEAIAGRNAYDVIHSAPVRDGGFIPHIIVSDYQLGGSYEGPSEIEKIREHFEYPALPAVLLTGDSSADQLRDQASSKLDVLHKPVRANELADLLIRQTAQR